MKVLSSRKSLYLGVRKSPSWCKHQRISLVCSPHANHLCCDSIFLWVPWGGPTWGRRETGKVNRGELVRVLEVLRENRTCGPAPEPVADPRPRLDHGKPRIRGQFVPGAPLSKDGKESREAGCQPSGLVGHPEIERHQGNDREGGQVSGQEEGALLYLTRWTDTLLSSQIRIRHKFIRAHSTLNPEDLEETESVATTTLSSVFPQPEKHWSTELSKYLWRNCNPGYILKTQQVPSTTKEHFSFDEEEVSYRVSVEGCARRRCADFDCCLGEILQGEWPFGEGAQQKARRIHKVLGVFSKV